MWGWSVVSNCVINQHTHTPPTHQVYGGGTLKMLLLLINCFEVHLEATHRSRPFLEGHRSCNAPVVSRRPHPLCTIPRSTSILGPAHVTFYVRFTLISFSPGRFSFSLSFGAGRRAAVTSVSLNLQFNLSLF